MHASSHVLPVRLAEAQTAGELRLLDRTSVLRSDVLDLLEAASDERPRTDDSAKLVAHLQHVANDLGAAERMLLHESRPPLAA